jgi:hypothetical protein
MTSRAEPLWKLDAGNMPGWKGLLAAGLITLLLLCLVPTIAGILGGMGVAIEPSVVFMGLAVAGLIGFLVWHDERLWLYLAILTHGLIMLDSTRGGIGSGEIGFAVVVLGGLILWFIKELLFYRRPIIRSGFDLLLLGFYCVSTETALVAMYIHGGNLLGFLKEWAIIVEMLFYFPLRKNMRNRKEVIIVLMLYVALAFGNGLFNLATYRSRLLNAVYMYELEASRTSGNTPTSVGLLILSATAFAYMRRWKASAISLGGTAVALLFVVIGFSRGPIIGGVFGIVILTVAAPLRSGKRVSAAFLGSILLGGVLIYMLFPSLSQSFVQSLAHRMATVSSARSDLSLRSRISESESLLLHYVPESPMLGYGYGFSFTFYDPIRQQTSHTPFIHNGYIWPFFKFGIPVTVLFFFVLVYPYLRLGVRKPRQDQAFEHALMVGTLGYMGAAMLTNITSSQFEDYPAIFNLVVCWALLEYVNRKAEPERIEPLGATAVDSDRLLGEG